jgi:hypothetical protein
MSSGGRGLTIELRGFEEAMRIFRETPDRIGRRLADGATLVGDAIINTTGLKRYPPEGPGNRPPVPFYQRGLGMWVYDVGNTLLRNTSSRLARLKGEGRRTRASYSRGGYTAVRNIRNLGNSERLGTQFYSLGEVSPLGVIVRIGNRASYSDAVVGDDQSEAMAAIGWRKLVDVAREKRAKITAILQAMIDDVLRRV